MIIPASITCHIYVCMHAHIHHTCEHTRVHTHTHTHTHTHIHTHTHTQHTHTHTHIRSLLRVCHDLGHDPEGGVLPGSLHPSISIVENRERALTVTDLELVLVLHYFDQRRLACWEGGREEVRQTRWGGSTGKAGTNFDRQILYIHVHVHRGSTHRGSTRQ